MLGHSGSTQFPRTQQFDHQPPLTSVEDGDSSEVDQDEPVTIQDFEDSPKRRVGGTSIADSTFAQSNTKANALRIRGGGGTDYENEQGTDAEGEEDDEKDDEVEAYENEIGKSEGKAVIGGSV